MSVYLSIELDVLVMLVMGTVLYKVKKNVDQQTTNVLFGHTLWATLFTSMFEAVSNGMSAMGSNTEVGLISLYVAVIVRYSLTGYLSYTWCMYLLFESDVIQKKFFNSKMNKCLAAIPAVILVVCTAVSPWTGWIFTVDADTGTFARGNQFFIQIIVTYIYFTVASVATMVYFIMRKNSKHRITQLLFVFAPFAGGVIHFFAPELAVMWPLVAILLMIKFIGFQEDQIFIDALTGLNNRRSFDKFLSFSMDEHAGRNVILYMIDVDHFKSINDTYGHVEGDAALVHTADILRTVCAGKNAFLARYGGDEFAIIYRENSREDANAFNKRILTAFEKYNRNAVKGSDYSIDISVGYAAAVRAGDGSRLQLVRKADAALYENKRSHSLVAMTN